MKGECFYCHKEKELFTWWDSYIDGAIRACDTCLSDVKVVEQRKHSRKRGRKSKEEKKSEQAKRKT